MDTDKTFEFAPIWAIISEKDNEPGTMRGHYFHQDLFVARQIYLANPKRHIDIGSRTDGFVAHVASYRTIELIDIRNIGSQYDTIIEDFSYMKVAEEEIKYEISNFQKD